MDIKVDGVNLSGDGSKEFICEKYRYMAIKWNDFGESQLGLCRAYSSPV